MNYRHAYHAGAFSDVFKHVILVMLLEALRAKPAPFFVLDSHAGLGWYDLEAAEALKTGEAAGGIHRLAANAPADAVPALRRYLDLVRAANGGDGPIRRYPGSPALIQALLRPDDRLALVELHPDDYRRAKATFAADPRIGVHHRDAYEALRALLPPAERRGLVLVDPPFERPDEFAALAAAVTAAHRRWPTGLYAIWYPVKTRAPVDRFLAALAGSGIARILAGELLVRPPEDAGRLNGCGMLLINPPWQTDRALGALLPVLRAALAEPGGSTRLDWLAGERAPAS